jgi:hypothetical protein
MKYRVEPIITPGCDCEDCQAGRHLYLLYRLPATGENWSAMSWQTYASADECKAKHPWHINFGPDATWEDGAPIVVPESEPTAQPDERGMVDLDAQAFAKSAAAVIRHWRG